jgi:hypothetical protein
MKRTVLALLALLVFSAPSWAAKATVVEYTEGKAKADSLAATADVLDAIRIPDGISALFIGVMADSSTLYTVDVSLDGTEWATAFIDTCIKGTYDEHELGVATGGAASSRPLYGILPGYWVRVTADNLTSTTCFAEIIRRYEKD